MQWSMQQLMHSWNMVHTLSFAVLLASPTCAEAERDTAIMLQTVHIAMHVIFVNFSCESASTYHSQL